jgi:cell wall assembly regulator SMI1
MTDARVASTSSRMKDVWSRLERWCQQHMPEVLKSLELGASESMLQATERRLGGQRLPEDVRESFKLHNGQDEESTGLLFGLRLLSLVEVEQFWSNFPGPGDEVNQEDSYKSVPEGAVQRLFTHPGWIPLTYDNGGNWLGVDLAPGPQGQVGQVIIFGRDEHTKYVVAPDWASLMEELVRKLKVGEFYLDPLAQGRRRRDFGTKNPDSAHFHDYVRKVAKAARKPARS